MAVKWRDVTTGIGTRADLQIGHEIETFGHSAGPATALVFCNEPSTGSPDYQPSRATRDSRCSVPPGGEIQGESLVPRKPKHRDEQINGSRSHDVKKRQRLFGADLGCRATAVSCIRLRRLGPGPGRQGRWRVTPDGLQSVRQQ